MRDASVRDQAASRLRPRLRGQVPPVPGAPQSFWGPACQFLPLAESSPRAQLGGVWAVRPAWDICSRQSGIKGEGWGWGLRTSPAIPGGAPSGPAARRQDPRIRIVFLSPGEQRGEVWARVFSLAFIPLAPPSDATREVAPGGQRAPCPAGAAPGPRGKRPDRGGRGPRAEGRIPRAANSRCWAPEPRPGRRAGGGLKTTQLKHRKHLGLHLGEGGA